MRYWDAVKERFYAVTGKDGAINMTLTGRIVEKSDGEITILAGDYDYLVSGLEMDEDWYSVGLYVGSEADLRIEEIWSSPDLLQIYKLAIIRDTPFSIRDIIGRQAVLAKNLSVRVTNKSTSDITIKYTVFGGGD